MKKCIRFLFVGLFNLLLVTTTFLVTIAGLELVTAYVKPHFFPSPIRDTSEILNGKFSRFYQYDSLLGHRGAPFVSSDDQEIKSNSQGFRGRDLQSKDPNFSKRIAIFGDSQIWGFAVPDSKTIPALLEKRVADFSSLREVHAYNMGIAGYSTDQELLLYLLTTKDIKVDDVVLMVFADNDFWEVLVDSAWGIERPKIACKNDKLYLTRVPVPYKNYWPGIRVDNLVSQIIGREVKFGNSQLFSLIAERSFTESFAQTICRATHWISGCVDIDENSRLQQINSYFPALPESLVNAPNCLNRSGSDLVIRLINIFNEEAKMNHSRFLVIIKTTMEDYKKNAYSSETASLIAGLKASGVPYKDLMEEGQKRAIPASDLFNSDMTHFSNKGNELTAEVIQETFYP